MKIKINKIFNVRIILLIACIVTFVLLNSSQENYVQVSQLTSTTLITTDVGPTNTTSDSSDTQENPDGPTFPSYTPPDLDGSGIFDQDDPTIKSQVIPIAVGAVIIITVVILILQQRKSVKGGTFYRPKERTSSTSIKDKRKRFRTQISTLMEILQQYLREGKYTEGIIFGFHQLDNNMKRILGIQRETYLTPKEFSQSMDLPEIVLPLRKIIDIFYLARYRIEAMKYEHLKEFIDLFQTLKNMSEFDSDIKIIRREQVGGEE